MRPIFSPTDFIQIKGRGTRKHNFAIEIIDPQLKAQVGEKQKDNFKMFDFFANCEYFEEKFNYNEVLKLPKPGSAPCEGPQEPPPSPKGYEHLGADIIASIHEEVIDYNGMKIDRMFFDKFEGKMRSDNKLAAAVEAGQWDKAIDYVNQEVFDKPEEFFSLDKLRKAVGADRKISIREILEKIFGLIPSFKSKDELLEEEFAKFVADTKPEEASDLPAIKNFFKAYVISQQIRQIIETRHFTDLATNPIFNTRDYKAVPEKYRKAIPEYVRDYVTLSQFV